MPIVETTKKNTQNCIYFQYRKILTCYDQLERYKKKMFFSAIINIYMYTFFHNKTAERERVRGKH